MKIKNVTGQIIFRKHEGVIIDFAPGVVVELNECFHLSSGLEVFKDAVKPLKKKVVAKPKKKKRSLKAKVFDLLDDGKINHSNE